MKKYDKGDWNLPKWWTDYPPVKEGRVTYEEQVKFYNGKFVREVLGHKGGITSLPKLSD
jgi:hypothetical protein